MTADIDRILISQSQIATRISALADQITRDHTPPAINSDAEITIVPIMTGGMIFAADLIRCLPMRMKIGLLTVSSYPGKSISSQGVSVMSQQIGDISCRHVLLIDDILDSGGTIRTVKSILLELSPASVKTCVLLRKPTEGAKKTEVDYVGFDIPDEFVVGYGLDYDNYYRNLPYIGTLKPIIYGR